MGDYDRSVAMIHKAMRLDPHHPVWYFSTLGINMALAGQYEEVVEHWRENRSKISPKNNVPEVNLIIAYRGLGDLENARRIATGLSRINANYTLESFRDFLPLKDKMRLDEMSSWLKEAGIPENTPRAQTK